MGTRSPQQRGTPRRVSRLISNFKFQISDFRAIFRLIILLCVFLLCTENSLAQGAATDKAAADLILAINAAGEEVTSGSNSEIKRDALFRLRNFQSPEASRRAVPGLRDSAEIVRATAAFAVIYLPKDEAFAALAPNLQDKSEIVRRETAYALGKVQNPAAINLLIQTFQNKREKSVEVKNAAIVALGEIGDAAAVDFLTQILRQSPNDDNDFERRSAARAIGQIAQITQIRKSLVVTPENFLPEKYKLAAPARYENLAADSPAFRAAVPVLLQSLQNAREADNTRREAAFALGTIGDSAALPALQNAVNSTDYYLAEIARESIKKLSSVGASN
jgi:HEAT repeat protein